MSAAIPADGLSEKRQLNEKLKMFYGLQEEQEATPTVVDPLDINGTHFNVHLHYLYMYRMDVLIMYTQCVSIMIYYSTVLIFFVYYRSYFSLS